MWQSGRQPSEGYVSKEKGPESWWNLRAWKLHEAHLRGCRVAGA